MPKKKEIIEVAEVIEESNIPATLAPLTENDKLALAVFNQTADYLKIINSKKAEYEALVITDVKDKAGYDAVKSAMGEIKNSRLAFDRSAQEFIIDPATKWLNGIKADLLSVSDALKGIEKGLRTKKDAHEDAKEKIKAEEELAKLILLQERVNDLNLLGAVFDGRVYSFPYDQSLIISVEDVKDLPSEKIIGFFNDVKEAYNLEQERINNELLAQQQREEEQRQANLLIEQQAEQNKKDALTLTEKRTKLRVKELMLMQFEETVMGDGDNLFEHEHSDRFFCLRDIKTLTDEDWEKSIEYHESKIMETRNVIAAKSMDEEIPATEPISDVQDNFVSTADVIAVVVSGGVVNNYSGIIAHAQQLSEENPSEIVESDYSLNEFEKFIQQYFKGTEKVKQQFLLAISEYKGLMDKM